MLLWTIIKVAFSSLLANKLRSFLAMLGIIIGVGAVIAMLAMGAGARRQIMERITAMGSNLLIVQPGQPRVRGVRSGSRETLTLEDARAIVGELEGVESISPVCRARAQIKYYGENSNSNVFGVASTYLEIRNFHLEKGRLFTAVEEEDQARVALLGATLAETLFGEQEALGESVKVNGVRFRVTGVLQARGDQGFFNPDDVLLVPYLTAMKQMLGRDFLSEIDVKAREDADMNRLETEIAALLRRRHRLGAEAEDDFHVRNQAEMVETAENFTRTFTILLASIAAISLVVGGIGIMNIMLVTVTERTREIGVRKAIGARRRDILRQFLLESILVSGLGGLLGIAAGVGAAAVVGRATQFQTAVEPLGIVLALAVSGAVGVFFGYYPAWRASRLDPIEALRYE